MESSVRNPHDTPSPTAATAPEAEVYVFPTTVAQRRFWLLDELAPGNPALNVPLAARLKGRVDAVVMECAVNEILRRHEILRSSFRMVGDELVQVAPPERRIVLRRYDITQVPESQREAKVQELMLQEGHRKFVLAEGPFLQAALATLSEDEHVLMLVMHHIACDGWSNGILMREVAQIYTALARNEPGLEDLPLQFADFALWQQDWLSGEGAQEQERFWLNRLQGKLSFLNLPTDRPRRSGRSHPGTIETRLLSRDLGDAIKAFCNREDLTPFMVFFSAFAILLSRYSGRRDIVVGSPAANRGQTELEGLIGLFANPLLLRINLEGNPTLSGLIARVKDLALGAFAHQAYPFERLMEKLELESNRAGLQWLQAYFVFQKAFMVPQEFHGGMLTPLRSISPGSMFEWMLGVLERGEGFRLQLEYNTDLFDAETIATMLEQFELLLGRLVREPGTRLDSIDILTPRERELFVLRPSQHRVRVPVGQRCHELFEERVRLQAAQVAFIGSGGEFTYATLNSWANRAALQLRKSGVGPESPVVIDLLQDSVECVVATLAVLKAGGACAFAASPGLDLATSFKALPQERQPAFVLTEKGRLSDWSNAAGCLLTLPEVESSDATSVAPNLSNIVLGDQPAWIHYVADADGALSSVRFQHKALLNRVVVDQQLFGIGATDRLRAIPDFFLSALVSGAALVQGAPAVSEGVASWLGWLERHGVTMDVLTEDTFEGWMWQLAEARLPFPKRLRTLVVGPTSASPMALATWAAWSSRDVRLLALLNCPEYLGPVQWGELVSGTDGRPLFKLGRAVPNARVLVLDDVGQPVPAGVPGWIHFAGDGLGLVHDDVAEKGVPSRWLARYDRGGALELVGERGQLALTPAFRLELREIETVLAEHPDVFTARIKSIRSGERSEVVAFVVRKNGVTVTEDGLREFIRGRLPEYMVPSRIYVDRACELSRDGRFLLELPEVTGLPAIAEEKVLDEPRNDLERTLSEIWAGVFRVERVGIHENFFDLGGDSLLTLQIISKAAHKGIKIGPKILWENPTIGSLSEKMGGFRPADSGASGALGGRGNVDKEPESEVSTAQVPIAGHDDSEAHADSFCLLLNPGAGKGLSPVFCLHFLTSARNLSKHLHSGHPVYGVHVPLDAELKRWHQENLVSFTLEALAQRYVDEIRKVQSHGPYYLVGFCFGGTLAYEVARQLRASGSSVGFLALLDISYVPGCKPISMPAIRRVRYHFGQLLSTGFGYLHKKIAWKMEKARKHRRAMASLKGAEESNTEAPPEQGVRLPQADFLVEILRRFRALPYVGNAVVVRSSTEPSFRFNRGAKNGWDSVIQGNVDVEELACGHLDMSEEPYVQELGRIVDKHLIRADGTAGSQRAEDGGLGA